MEPTRDTETGNKPVSGNIDIDLIAGGIVQKLEKEAENRVTQRLPYETRWLEDLKQLHSVYDDEIQNNLLETKGSRLFINLTRVKTEAMAARLMDLLFPTDDKNWGIQPTPVPRLADDAKRAQKAAMQLADQAKTLKENQEKAQIGQNSGEQGQVQYAEIKRLEQVATAAETRAQALKEQLDEARKRSQPMERTIDDQLKESQYTACQRDLIEQACKIGTGVCKGPLTGEKIRKGWKPVQVANPDGTFSQTHELQFSEQDQPAMRWVDLWSYFPSMDAKKPEDSDGDFERHLYNKKQMRALGRRKGFRSDVINSLLESDPETPAPNYVSQLRNIAPDSAPIGNKFYVVWEYTGVLEHEDAVNLATHLNDDEMLEELANKQNLAEIAVCVWFCNGRVLKFDPHPYDSGESIYSVFSLIEDETSIFGYGIPAIMRDPQKALAAAWRTMMDNAGLASGPQVVYRSDLIEPVNGKEKLEPRKLWRWTGKSRAPTNGAERPFETFDIPINQAEMERIIHLAIEFIDLITGMPPVVQGEPGSQAQQTYQGTALIMNAANVTVRRLVKNYDDGVTVPTIRRFYDWNMQHHPDEGIKGDFGVDARGSSVLLVREMQAQNLFMIAMQLGAHPIYGPMLKHRDVLKRLLQAHMVPADELLLTDEEIGNIVDPAAAQAQALQAAEERQHNLEMEKLRIEEKRIDTDAEMKTSEYNMRIMVAETQQETAMITLAEKLNMSADDLATKLQIARENNNTKERLAAAEAVVTEQVGPGGGGYF